MNPSNITPRIVLVSLLSVGLFPGSVSAQDFVYQPINPSFGGSSFNSAHLLGIAAIDRPDPPSSDGIFGSGVDAPTQADLFAERLERAILGRLSSQITDAIFGDTAEESGEFVIDETRIVFDTTLDGTIDLRIIDRVSGDETQIQVPGSLRGQ